MSGLGALLKSRDRFVGLVTASWTALAALVLIGRRILTGSFGSPEFVGVALLAPVVAVFWALVMWKFFIGPKIKGLTGKKN